MINWELSREMGGLPGKCGRSLFLLFFVSFAVRNPNFPGKFYFLRKGEWVL
jgi:hypothetical protein